MERCLYLFRHGQAEDSAGEGDHRRELTARGAQDVRRVGQFFARQPWPLERILVSSATRTIATGEILLACLESLQPRPVVKTLDSLYLAEASQLLTLIRSQPRDCRSLLLVGHNPGLSELAASLLRPVRLAGLRTTGLVVISLADDWSSLAPGRGQLVYAGDAQTVGA